MSVDSSSAQWDESDGKHDTASIGGNPPQDNEPGVRPPPANGEGRKSSEDKHRSYELAYWICSTFLTGVLAIGAIVSAIYAIDAARQSRAQADAAQAQLNQMLVQNRLASIQLNPRLRLKMELSGKTNDGSLFVTPVWHNYGMSDPSDVTGCMQFDTIPGDVNFGDPATLTRLNSCATADDVEATSAGEYEQSSARFDAKSLDAILNKTASGFIWGELSYHDPSPDGRIHQNQWCYKIVVVGAADGGIKTAAFPYDASCNRSK